LREDHDTDPPKMGPGTWVLFCLALFFGLILAKWAFNGVWQQLPDTASAKAGFHELTGHDPKEVQAIYFDEHQTMKDPSRWLGFTYPDDQWLAGFLREHSALVRQPGTSAGLEPGPGARWWDTARVWNLKEWYDTEPKVYYRYQVWVDRENRRVYLHSFTM
jgi:hypothetical protein